MKNIIKRLIAFLLLMIVMLPLLSYLWVVLQQRKELNILILDKTVLLRNTQEHNSLNWVLTQNKYVKSDGQNYDRQNDYFGFFPDGEGHYAVKDFNDYTPFDLDSLVNHYDMTYYTDTYGVFQSEWYAAYMSVDPKEMQTRAAERSSLIYGGMTPKEVAFLGKMKDRKKLIIAEFNIMASPTSSHVRRLFEREFSVRWSGWVGRYFETLDTTINKELPLWLKRNYKQQNNGKWPFTKPGIAFVRTDDRLVIVEQGTHLNVEVPIICTAPNFMEQYGLPSEMKYPFWFDICSIKEPNYCISRYKIDVNPIGDSILRANRIPTNFPAVIANTKTYPFYYFAGDFADNPISLTSARFKNVHWVSAATYQPSNQERNSFFWGFYRPLLESILDDYYNTIKSKQ